MPLNSTRERVVLDSSALLGDQRRALIAAAALGYYDGFWSTWIVSEFVRLRTEWIANRAVREGCDRAETRRRLRASRQRVNGLIDALSHVLVSVDYAAAPAQDLEWLRDRDDWPVMQTALAARADTLVTDNTSDFLQGTSRNGIRIMGSRAFIAALYRRIPDAEATLREFLRDPDDDN